MKDISAYNSIGTMLPMNNPVQSLNRIYLEVTNRCNLNCSICIRNVWDDVPGSLSYDTYHKILKDIQDNDLAPEIFFGGFGEPLSHPDIIKMIQGANRQGLFTSLVTNGILLSQEMSETLITKGLDRLWISLDGPHSESYQDIQLGEYLPQIIQNIKQFQKTRLTHKINNDQVVEWGIAFVLMKKNASDLPELIELGKELGTNSFFVTYLEAYSEALAQETLYPTNISRYKSGRSTNQPQVRSTEITLNEILDDISRKYLKNEDEHINIDGSLQIPDRPECPFVERGALAVRWDGEVSPCLPLLYSHTSTIGSWNREVHSYSIGNVTSRSILDLWSDSEYIQLRERLLDQRFSPCTNCRDCWLSEDNLLDCMGYEHPTCGGCLWAQGIIQCP